VHQIAKKMLEAMMPEEDTVMPRNLHCSLHCNLDYVVEIPIEAKKIVIRRFKIVDTYILPSDNCSGLMLVFLK
jgi:hypothetical protein